LSKQLFFALSYDQLSPSWLSLFSFVFFFLSVLALLMKLLAAGVGICGLLSFDGNKGAGRQGGQTHDGLSFISRQWGLPTFLFLFS
jgi:hypothetical protein